VLLQDLTSIGFLGIKVVEDLQFGVVTYAQFTEQVLYTLGIWYGAVLLHILFDIIVAHATCCRCTCSIRNIAEKRPKKAATCNSEALQKMQPAACACINLQLLVVRLFGCSVVWLFRCLPFLFASSNEDMTPTENEDTSCNCNSPLAFRGTGLPAVKE